jgi:putative FmdB family regulatory protein
MPIYEFHCPKCNVTQERLFSSFLSMSEKDDLGEILCEVCQSKLERVPSACARTSIKWRAFKDVVRNRKKG